LNETVSALVYLQGEEEVRSYIEEKRLSQLRQIAEQEKASLDQAISDGYVTKVDVIAEKSLIVGRYINKDGSIQEPGRTQLVVPGIHQKYHSQLLGKGVGTVLSIDDGAKFEVLEVYHVDEEKAKTSMAEKQAAAAAAATNAASAVAAADETAETKPSTETTSTQAEVAG
jgi:flagellar hook-associated protein FlgK